MTVIFNIELFSFALHTHKPRYLMPHIDHPARNLNKSMERKRTPINLAFFHSDMILTTCGGRGRDLQQRCIVLSIRSQLTSQLAQVFRSSSSGLILPLHSDKIHRRKQKQFFSGKELLSFGFEEI